MSFCTLYGFRLFQIISLESMAGTTGLEPATSAVTVLPFQVFQRLTNPWGTPKTTKVVKAAHFVDRIVDRKSWIISPRDTAPGHSR